MTMLQGMATDSAARMAEKHKVRITEAAMDWMLEATDDTVPGYVHPMVADREFPDFHDAWLEGVIREIAPRKIVRREDVAWEEAGDAGQ